MREANDKVANFRGNEKSKWAQRAKVKHVHARGNHNTNYFHLFANSKHKRKQDFQT
jgi:hypothetical protein